MPNSTEPWGCVFLPMGLVDRIYQAFRGQTERDEWLRGTVEAALDARQRGGAGTAPSGAPAAGSAPLLVIGPGPGACEEFMEL